MAVVLEAEEAVGWPSQHGSQASSVAVRQVLPAVAPPALSCWLTAALLCHIVLP